MKHKKMLMKQLENSFCMPCSYLIGMVNILNSLFGTKVKSVTENVINADIPIHGLGWLTRYLAMIVGALMTILVQSPSVFTLTMTPLDGVCVFHFKTLCGLSDHLSEYYSNINRVKSNYW